MNDDVRSAIISRSSAATIRQIAVEQGMCTLREDAVKKVRDGLTTLEEVIRVTTE
ncbi:MAG: hypothetical protein GX139_12170 [Armatimonadetes bacterium]|nr:hypothetical protein [Armatimonadota bacterium]